MTELEEKKQINDEKPRKEKMLINEDDLKIDTYQDSRRKYLSVRVTHLPTGTVIYYKKGDRKEALEGLRVCLAQMEQE